MRSFAKKTLLLIRTGWLIVGIVLLLALGLEGAGRVYYWFRATPPGDAHDATLDCEEHYPRAAWYDTYLAEHAALKLRWLPYVYWRCEPFQGTCINVDQQGLRRTVPNTPASEATARVFLFGGSSMWGQTVPDEFTIPSHLAKHLQSAGLARVQIVNFGQIGYVSTQELLTLLLELRRGNVPDVAVFYDGVNDTYSAYQQDRPGIPSNEGNRIKEFDALREGKGSNVSLSKSLDELAISKMAQGINRRLGLQSAPAMSTSGDSKLDRLAEGVVATYFENLRCLRLLAQEYKFSNCFFWQPVVYSKKTLADHEDRLIERRRLDRPGEAAFFGNVYERVRKEGVTDDFQDLSAIFDQYTATAFGDFCHLTQTANGVIAERISSRVADILRRKGVRFGEPGGK